MINYIINIFKQLFNLRFKQTAVLKLNNKGSRDDDLLAVIAICKRMVECPEGSI